MGPSGRLIPVIDGGCVTVNDIPLLALPFTVTTMFPVVAPLGTATTMVVSLHVVGTPGTPLKLMVLLPCATPKFDPTIVTDVQRCFRRSWRRQYRSLIIPMTNIGTPDTLYRLAPPLIALQFVAFGWRVNRELNLGFAERGTFVLIPDALNIVSLFAAVICLIMLPIATDTYCWLSRMVLAGGYVLIAFHPFTVAAHFRLWSRDAFANTSEMAKTAHMRRARSLFPRRCPLSWQC
ncbi:MAG: hypothetical protein JWM43_1478 [Acidobacteriaceae bacterium]|nr:hypothetical protein [Acidobacteriaceae bacterium]